MSLDALRQELARLEAAGEDVLEVIVAEVARLVQENRLLRDELVRLRALAEHWRDEALATELSGEDDPAS